MKYIESYLEYEMKFKTLMGIVVIPKKSYTEYEINSGKRRVVTVEDSQIEELSQFKIFQSLLKKQKGGIRILDTLPSKYRLSSEIIKEKEILVVEKNTENEKLKKEIERLKKKLAEAK
jgi:bifunctional DNA-binding transcriptional regulator/antitoxin component of YhaV-PrlF toxin-antitoxin module